MLVDGCFLTWVQVTEHYHRSGKITGKTRDFRAEDRKSHEEDEIS